MNLKLAFAAAVLVGSANASAAPIVYLISQDVAAETNYATLIQNALGAGTVVNVVPQAQYDNSGTGLDSAELSLLEAADLVVISRNTNSGGFDGSVVASYNNLSTPILLNNPLVARDFRFNWVGTGSSQTTNAPFSGLTLRSEPGDIALDYFGVTEDLQFLSTSNSGNGELEAYLDVNNDGNLDAGDRIGVVNWDAGVAYRSGGPTAGGLRTLFTLDGYDSAADFDTDLTEAGRAALSQSVVAIVPEPASAGAIFAGLGGLLLRRRTASC